MFYDFAEHTEDGTAYTASHTQALVAEVLDARVATVTVSSPGRPDLTASPVLGSVVVPGLRSDRQGTADGRVVVRVVVRDAAETVLEEFTREF